MVTFFSVPKAFAGDMDIVQRNSIASWLSFANDVQVVLCGEEHGVPSVAGDFGVQRAPRVKRNEYGTPLLHSVFSQAAKLARHDVLCYVNCDVILAGAMAQVAETVRRRQLVVVSRRRNLTKIPCLDAHADDFKRRIAKLAATAALDGPETALDVLAFPSESFFTDIPAFAVGRPGWDNWYLFHALKHWRPVADATAVLEVMHQPHDYGHVPDRAGSGWEGPEANRNRELAGGWQALFSLLDVSHTLGSHGLRPARSARHVSRRVERLPVLRQGLCRWLPSWKLRYAACRFFPTL